MAQIDQDDRIMLASLELCFRPFTVLKDFRGGRCITARCWSLAGAKRIAHATRKLNSTIYERREGKWFLVS